MKQLSLNYTVLEYEYLHVPSGTQGTRKFEGTAQDLLMKLNAWNRQFPGVWVYWHKTLGRMYP